MNSQAFNHSPFQPTSPSFPTSLLPFFPSFLKYYLSCYCKQSIMLNTKNIHSFNKYLLSAY